MCKRVVVDAINYDTSAFGELAGHTFAEREGVAKIKDMDYQFATKEEKRELWKDWELKSEMNFMGALGNMRSEKGIRGTIEYPEILDKTIEMVNYRYPEIKRPKDKVKTSIEDSLCVGAVNLMLRKTGYD